ncbi:unnamed protein product [Clonostachys byssicola]|uniref:Branched-chain-amino-acid aminotransferase n=1 Tax=Clonostachys byssicola TaxID=160290 RepID=A0A9N9U4M8_9HYPO|nr:unnamed protein product [Clonostachys byssicola]
MSPSASSPAAAQPVGTNGQEPTKTYREMDASTMTTSLVPEAEQPPVPGLQDPGRLTQKLTTAHMVQAPWVAGEGWGSPHMGPYGKIALEPTASVLHYATESFEGMKVYRGYDGKVRLFRPWLNCQRMNKSNARVCLPAIDPDQLLALISKFLAIECRRWLPEPGSHLYLRPATIGSGSALGIQRPPEALFFLFAALFPQSSNGPSPGMRLLASDSDLIRAWPGGFGGSKVGANYGPAMVAQAKARENNCGQTLWLFGEDRQVTEAGASNFFVVWKRKDSDTLELVTASLDTEVILDGITRRSVLDLARQRLTKDSADLPQGFQPVQVVERTLNMHEIVEAQKQGRLIEAFVSGTAMFVMPISEILYDGVNITLPRTVGKDGTKLPVSKYSSTIKMWLSDIMFGKVEHEWAYVIDEN